MQHTKPAFGEALREALLVLTGIAIAILFIMGAVSVWRAHYRSGIFFFVLGIGLTFVFFRKQKTAPLMIGLIWMVVNAGINAIVHPTALGILVTVGSAVGIALLGRWQANHRRGGDAGIFRKGAE